MATILKQSTAVDVLIGPFVDSTDGVTAETGLTLSASDIKLSKNGQTLAAKNDATAAAHDADGLYNCELDSTDTNTVGSLVISIQESGALPVRHEFQIVEEAIYDALFASSATGFDSSGRVDVGTWLGNAVTHGTGGPDVNINAISDDTGAATNLEAMFDGSGYAGGTIKLGVDIVAISGDTNAANNLESDYDGNGYTKTNSTIGTCTTNTDMLTAAQVNTQVIDVLNIDTYSSDLSAVPAANSTIFDKIHWLFMLARNKRTSTSTTETLYKDDTTTSAATATISDDGTTTTRGEYS